ncbi:MAG: phosphate/phosphite/phosphonate ABC transporter substrate-binding protein [bacterium]|nr:phosphate/phosphite/phosphonate ABC transporter substrate-binding protein [bacterium]
MRVRPILVITLLLGLGVGGCSEGALFSASVWDPFGLKQALGLQGEPVRIGLSHEQRGIFDVSKWGKKAPWDDLVRQLSRRLGRPVVVENLKPFQIEFHLRETQQLDFALVTADDYLMMTEETPVGQVVALSEALVRQGVVVARAGSDVDTVADLKGRHFALGPRDDPVLHLAALAYLGEQGVAKEDLRTLLPGQLQFHLSSFEVAKEVVYGLAKPVAALATEAGVIEAEEFDAYPEKGGRWIPLATTFSKDQFRVLGRTEPHRVDTMAEGPFIAGAQVEPELVEAVRDFLLTAADEHPEAPQSMGFARFRSAPSDPTDEIKRLATAPSP